MRYKIEQNQGNGWEAPNGYTLSRQTEEAAVDLARIMKRQDHIYHRPLDTTYRVVDNMIGEEVWNSVQDSQGKTS